MKKLYFILTFLSVYVLSFSVSYTGSFVTNGSTWCTDSNIICHIACSQTAQGVIADSVGDGSVFYNGITIAGANITFDTVVKPSFAWAISSVKATGQSGNDYFIQKNNLNTTLAAASAWTIEAMILLPNATPTNGTGIETWYSKGIAYNSSNASYCDFRWNGTPQIGQTVNDIQRNCGAIVNNTVYTPDENWHYVAAVFNGSTIVLYYDENGTQITAIQSGCAMNPFQTTGDDPIRWLTSTLDYKRPFIGNISEIWISNIARSTFPYGPVTATPQPTPTNTPTWTPTNTPTWTPTYSPTWTPTYSPTWTPTYSPTWSPTYSPTWSPTYTITPTVTITPTITPVPPYQVEAAFYSNSPYTQLVNAGDTVTCYAAYQVGTTTASNQLQIQGDIPCNDSGCVKFLQGYFSGGLGWTCVTDKAAWAQGYGSLGNLNSFNNSLFIYMNSYCQSLTPDATCPENESCLYWATQPNTWQSTDGRNWTDTHTTLSFGSRSNLVFLSWAGNDYLVASSLDGNENAGDVWVSGDGFNFELFYAGTPWAGIGISACINNGYMWVMGGGWSDRGGGHHSNEVFKSSDAYNWTDVGTASWSPRNSAACCSFNNLIWIIAGNGGCLLDCNAYLNDCWYSADGTNWTETTDNINGIYADDTDFAVAYNNILYVIQKNNISYSEDGYTWQKQKMSMLNTAGLSSFVSMGSSVFTGGGYEGCVGSSSIWELKLNEADFSTAQVAQWTVKILSGLSGWFHYFANLVLPDGSKLKSKEVTFNVNPASLTPTYAVWTSTRNSTPTLTISPTKSLTVTETYTPIIAATFTATASPVLTVTPVITPTFVFLTPQAATVTLTITVSPTKTPTVSAPTPTKTPHCVFCFYKPCKTITRVKI